MIEIVFSESACGSLKCAQHYGEGDYRGGSIGVMISHEDGSKPSKEEIKAAQRQAGERQRLAWESTVPLGGNPADVYGFGLMLSIGDISEKQPGDKRRQTLEHLFSIYSNGEGFRVTQEIWERANQDLQTVRERATSGESLRIWYSSQPDEMCGLYWFMEQLEQWNVPGKQIFIVKLPEWEANEKGDIMVRRTGWNEVAPEGWHRYISLQQAVPSGFKKDCASHWQTIQEENTPLRAVLNGQLVSVPEDLYDCFILREMEEETEEFQEARLIGRVIGHGLGVGDAWIALRIEQMIHDGKLEIVSANPEDSPVTYIRVLKKI